MENKRNGIVGTSGPRPVGIICALEVELKDLLAELRDREDVVFNGYEFHCGRFGEIPAVLVQCGVGKVNAARGTQMLLEAFGGCCVINSGIAGGTKPGLAIGDIVIGKDLAQHDFDVTAFGYALGYMCTGENSNEPTRFTAEPVLVEELEQAAYKFVDLYREGGEMHIRGGVARLIESAVFTKEKMEAMGIPEGTLPTGWWIGFQVTDADVWEKVKDGTYSMFSIEGEAKRVEVEDEESDQ